MNQRYKCWEYKRLFSQRSTPPLDEIAALGREGWEMFWHESGAQWYAWWLKRQLLS